MSNSTYHLITYGCQMNKSDSERIRSVLENAGFRPTTQFRAKYVFLNLCSVRQSAIDRVWGKLRELKKNNPQVKIILTGCILPQDQKKFKVKVDHILNIVDLLNWPQIIFKNQTNPSLRIASSKHIKEYLSVEPKHNSRLTAYVPIMTGCNNFCSYCAVPYVRGRERSRTPKDILVEVNKLIVQGYRQIILLGQNINSYSGQDNNGKKINFPKLLKMIDNIPGDHWLTFISSHPKDLTAELIKCFQSCEHLMPYLHLALQSGSNKILKDMNRHYTTQKFSDLVKKVRQARPDDIALSTDIIVGFPGETQADFEDTVKLMRELKFDMAYLAQYSPRFGTAAASLDDNVSQAEKKKREKILNNILIKTALIHNKKLIGKTIKVLVEFKKDNNYFGKTAGFKNVKIKVSEIEKERKKIKTIVGKFIDVKITKVTAWNLEGELLKIKKPS